MSADFNERGQNAVITEAFNQLYQLCCDTHPASNDSYLTQNMEFDDLYLKLFGPKDPLEDSEETLQGEDVALPSNGDDDLHKNASSRITVSRKGRPRKKTEFYSPKRAKPRSIKGTKPSGKFKTKKPTTKRMKRAPIEYTSPTVLGKSTSVFDYMNGEPERFNNDLVVPVNNSYVNPYLNPSHPDITRSNYGHDPLEYGARLPNTFMPFQSPGSILFDFP
ncbi:hypothetical protein DSO57_1035557 [Entomophthora muscae]|uniref:Uncharacterized protein n=2 Tax=Entomophthora muscae TaxID=34485 RepID=A0ACC2U8I4_9FUNG|nr:hypothetical protein DSO57_1035557 [Entomophthora muscae]